MIPTRGRHVTVASGSDPTASQTAAAGPASGDHCTAGPGLGSAACHRRLCLPPLPVQALSISSAGHGDDARAWLSSRSCLARPALPRQALPTIQGFNCRAVDRSHLPRARCSLSAGMLGEPGGERHPSSPLTVTLLDGIGSLITKFTIMLGTMSQIFREVPVPIIDVFNLIY